MNALKDGQQTNPHDEALRTKYTNPGNKRNPWSNMLHKEVCIDQLSDKGKKFEEDFWKMMLANAGKITSRKRKAYTTLEVAAVHELDSDSNDDESSGRCGAGIASTISELSSHVTRQSLTV